MWLVPSATLNTFCTCLLAGTILLGLVWLAMLALPQPASRVFAARCGLLCLPFVLLIAGLDITPKFEVVEPTVRAFRLLIAWVDPGRFNASAIDGRSEIGLAPGSSLHSSPLGLAIKGLSIVYGICVGLGMIRLALGWSFGRLLCNRGWHPPASIVDLARDLTKNRSKSPRIRISTKIDRPLLVGIFKPTILLPLAILERGSEQDLRSILRHELGHLEMSDPFFAFFGQCLSVFAFPIVPLTWILAQARLDQEYLADARTVRTIGDPAIYAATLLAVSGQTKIAATSREIFGDRNRILRSALSLRILMLLRPRFPIEFRPSRSWMVACVTIFAAAGMIAASLRAKPASAIVYARERDLAPLTVSTRTFKIASLIVSHREGDSVLLELPSLTGRTVTVEGTVLADPAMLSDLEVVGLPLQAPADLVEGVNQSHRPIPHGFRAEITEGLACLSVGESPATHYWLVTDPVRLTFKNLGDQPVTFLNVKVSW